MGVPKFAAWLTKKYPSMVVESCPNDVHGLYIDLNGLIHPCCHSEHDPSVALRTQEEKLRSICLAIETLVVTVRPKHVVYIAIDGVAPRAKMNQQRARRYMRTAVPLTETHKPIPDSSHDVGAAVVAEIQNEFTHAECDKAEQELEEVRQALMEDVLYGGNVSMGPDDETSEGAGLVMQSFASGEMGQGRHRAALQVGSQPGAVRLPTKFDSNCISPGTAFMDAVAAAVRDYIRRKLAPRRSESRGDTEVEAGDSASLVDVASPLSAHWAGRTVVFSDANTAGEGEHKLIDFLRTQSSFSGFNGRGCHVIAGLDADLVFLSLSLHIPHVFILRDHKRSSYSQALLSRSAGGTLVEKSITVEEKQQQFQDMPVASWSMISLDSAAVPAAVPASTGGDDLTAVDGPVCTMTTTTTTCDNQANRMCSRRSAAPSSPVMPGATTPATTSPYSIADVVVEPCTSYEYFDVDVVGASVVSEVYELCLEKGMRIRGNPLEDAANCVAANGFRFHHCSGVGPSEGGGVADIDGGDSDAKGAGFAASKRDLQRGGKDDAKRKAQSTPLHPCTSTSNSKIIDDFIVLGILLGNDFLPHLPSVYCGESAMDTLLDVYVGAVLPHGYLTGGTHEIQLVQLERLFRAYAAVEAARFRQFAIQSGVMTPQEAATPVLCSAADRRCWRDTYVRTTSLRDEAGVQAACRSYVEGMRFVWRYYSAVSLEVSWGWYYGFHHAPLALDIADFLRAQGPQVQNTLAAPKLEQRPPSPFSQLLCILPPQSSDLVPEALRDVMVSPPTELADCFPRCWEVDSTGAYGMEHLAAVLLPFANLPQLQELVAAASGTYTAAEQTRNALRSGHLVFEGHPAHLGEYPRTASNSITPAVATAKNFVDCVVHEGTGLGPTCEAQRASTRGFRIQGNGLTVLPTREVPPDMRTSTDIVCSLLVDTEPHLSRPRTYSYTVPIPGLTALPDGSRRKAEKRRWPRKRGTVARPPNSRIASAAADEAVEGESAQPAMLFGEFVICVAAMGVLTAGVTVWNPSSMLSLLRSAQILLQLCGIAVAVVWLAFALGLAVVPKSRTAGVSLNRHNIFTAFADWQCSLCLSLNFQRNTRCFICRAPYDPHRCVALYSSRCPPAPPLMDPDHLAYTTRYGTTAVCSYD
ncbi:hypothetical protein JKF63_05504 [Porcisia hertigi]|uniref:RanBP2-type domain-containing protein n=1 Tax=Porcisia hertigi TaxID=2761500 RepID=A0A836ISN8_9TRYP|nr:hypothetical protein JKF63_05504 [Porcisia hertigi]